jgi:hypothetical protein
MKFLAACLMAVAGIVLLLGDNQAGEKAKYTIKEVMKEAHKGGLMKKVADGKADDTEKKKLVELYKALAQNTPPKGDADDWKMKTTALVDAATKAASGDATAATSLTKLANCMACHKEHK